VRKIVVGDICGDVDLLKQLFDQLSITSDDYILFTGSYLGPGPDSKATLDYLIDFQQKHPKCDFLRGCYEHTFEQIISDQGWRDRHLQALWKAMGGSKVFQSYAKVDEISVAMPEGKIERVRMPFIIPEPHIRFLEKNLHLWYMDHEDPFVVFHAGPDTKNFMNPRSENVLIGEKDWWLTDFEIPGQRIIFSHVPFNVPFRDKHGKRGIDLGCGRGMDKLCAYIADQDDFVVAAKTISGRVN